VACLTQGLTGASRTARTYLGLSIGSREWLLGYEQTDHEFAFKHIDVDVDSLFFLKEKIWMLMNAY
jgi:hypothetical protein